MSRQLRVVGSLLGLLIIISLVILCTLRDGVCVCFTTATCALVSLEDFRLEGHVVVMCVSSFVVPVYVRQIMSPRELVFFVLGRKAKPSLLFGRGWCGLLLGRRRRCWTRWRGKASRPIVHARTSIGGGRGIGGVVLGIESIGGLFLGTTDIGIIPFTTVALHVGNVLLLNGTLV